MSTFHVFIECLPWLGFVGFGLYFLLTDKYVNRNASFNPNSWLRQLGFAKPRKLIAEGDFDEKSALLLYYALATFFLFIGIGGLILILYRSIT